MKIMLCYAVTIKMNLSRGIWALPSIFKLGETIISFHCSTIMLGTWDGVRFLLEGKLRAVPGLAHCCFYSSVMTWFPGLGAVQAWWEGQLLSPEHVAPSPYRHTKMLLTPGTVSQTLELNEMFHMCQTKHMSKSPWDLGHMSTDQEWRHNYY